MARYPRSAATSTNSPTLEEFEVDLENFQGPFDLLLQLIARKQLDITEISLAEVTDEFIAHMERVPDLSTATSFLVVAATLLEMKAAQLLPQFDLDDGTVAEDLEARDLLFSRLLQYRAFKEAGKVIQDRFVSESFAFPRLVPLEPHFASLLPQLVWNTSPEELARYVESVLAEKPSPDQGTHIARSTVSFDDELVVVERRLRLTGVASFAEIVADAANSAVIVTRFLAVLELYRRGLIRFRQVDPLGPLVLHLETENHVN